MNPPCRLARRCSTSTATTSDREVAARPSPPWSGCSRPLGIAAPAVRTAISRMVRQGWLAAGPARRRPRATSCRSGRCTGSTRRRPASTAPAARLGRPVRPGRARHRPRTAPPAARLTATLSYLGLRRTRPAHLGRAPRRRRGRRAAAGGRRELRTVHRRPRRRHPGAAALVRRAWDLAALAAAYDRFVAEQGRAMADGQPPAAP